MPLLNSPRTSSAAAATIRERGKRKRFSWLTPADASLINAAGRGAAGIVFPPRDGGSATRLLTADKRRNGKPGYVVRAGNVVGFVGLPSGRALHIQSKLGDVGVFWLLAHALDVAQYLKHWTEMPEQRADPLEWLLLLLRNEVRALVHSGLRKDYLPVEETLGIVRGRVLPARTLVETRGLSHRVTCLYDDFTADVFDNQVLRLALRTGAACSPGMRAALLGTDALLEGDVSYEPLNRAVAADNLKRLLDARHPSRRAYVAAHTLAYIVLRLLSYSDFGSSTRRPGVLLNMEKLFERALRNILEREFGHEKFSPKAINFGPNVAKGLKPDIRLRGLLVDAKYKEKPLAQRNGGLQPPDGDVFQAHTYSYFGKRPCALVYATGEDNVLAGGLAQDGVTAPSPRVGLFSLNIAGKDCSALEAAREKLVGQLRAFAIAQTNAN